MAHKLSHNVYVHLQLAFVLLSIMFLRFIHVDTCRSFVHLICCIIFHYWTMSLYLSLSLLMGIDIVIISNTILVSLCPCMRISLEDTPRGKAAIFFVYAHLQLNQIVSTCISKNLLSSLIYRNFL